MIYRLRYCNKDGVEARVDIQKGLATPVVEVDGTERPFILSYNNDKGDKSGMFLSSSADIEIYETPEFNIDNLKTSNETELSVTHYINNVISWQGFIIPDFFSIDVRNNPVITMTASDRLGTLKNATLSDLPSMISLRELAILCLNKTGLELPLKTMADFNNGTGVNDFFNSKILTQRLSDTKGRSISCYDILSSILTASNSFLVQRTGAWHIINKIQHEAGSGSLYSDATTSTAWSDKTVNFSDVNVGARRKIIPVASMVGVYHEHGGGRLHPYNYDFSQGLTGWTAINGFNASIYDREILYYLNGNPYYGDTTDHNYLVNLNERVSGSLTLDTAPYLQSEAIPVVSTQGDMVDISLDINITAPGGGSNSSFPSFVRYAIIATNGSETYALNRAGTFDVYDATNLDHSQTVFIGSDVFGQITAVSKGQLIKGKLERDLSDYTITVRIYGSGTYQVTTVNFISVQFSNSLEVPKGTMYKREQGSNYTKTHEIQTVLWGDYLTNGLNGYFYEYPIDDTSSLYNASNELTSKWTAYNDPEQLPLLQHITRQKSRLFSVAHDLLSAEIEVNNFDPLAIFVACEKRYTVVSAQFDFFKSNLSVELEEVAFQSASVRDFIYSYFGDGESGIKSIGGISGGSGGGTGGGLTPEQLEILSWWKKDPDNPNTIFTEMNAYSKLELSAYGVGDGGGGGGSDYERLDTWASYDSTKSGWVLSALLGVDLNTRVGNLEGGSALTVNTTGTGNAITSISKAGTVITATKGLTFSLDGHTHAYLPLSGGTMANTNLVTNLNADLLDGYHSNRFALQGAPAISTDFLVWDGATLFGLRAWAPSTPNYPGDPYGTALDFKDATTWYHRLAFGTSGRIRYYNGINTTTLTKRGDLAFTTDNVASATKLQTARTIWGQSFDGTGNVNGILTGVAGLVGNASALGVETSVGNVGGAVFDGSANSFRPYISQANIINLGRSDIRWNNVYAVNGNYSTTVTALTIAASTSVTTPKVIFAAAGWSMEQSGTEIQFKYNGAIKQRLLSDGTIVGIGEITAFGSTT